MKHEHPYTEDLSTDALPSSPDFEADPSPTEFSDRHQNPTQETAWDNWKSVRDVV